MHLSEFNAILVCVVISYAHMKECRLMATILPQRVGEVESMVDDEVEVVRVLPAEMSLEEHKDDHYWSVRQIIPQSSGAMGECLLLLWLARVDMWGSDVLSLCALCALCAVCVSLCVRVVCVLCALCVCVCLFVCQSVSLIIREVEASMTAVAANKTFGLDLRYSK